MNSVFIKLVFRKILKERISSFINISGFSIGMAVCLFIFLFVKYETSFDGFYPNADKLYRVVGTYKSNNENSRTGFMWFPVAKDIKNEIPGVDDFCRVSGENKIKCFVKNKLWNINKLRFADANFFEFFGFQLLVGNPKTVLSSTDKIVLTEKKAKQLFGKTSPLGKVVMYNHKPFTVSGIAANSPPNTHLVFDALISTNYMEENKSFWTGYGGGVTLLSYLQLANSVTPQQVEKALPSFLYQKINKRWKDTGMALSASLQRIQDVHLSDGSIDYDLSTNRSKKSIFIIVSICLLILLLAVINYIVLFAAQRIAKGRDIGILKVYGAGGYSLMLQTFIEVLFIISVASVMGVFLLALGTPLLNEYLQTSILLEEDILLILIFLLIVNILLSISITLVSNRGEIFSKPDKPVASFATGGSQKRLKGSLLVSFQFAVVIMLLIAVFIVTQQNNFLLHTNLGFEKENILILESDESFVNDELSQFKQELTQLAGIYSVSLSSELIGTGLTQNGYTIGEEKNVSMLNVLYTDTDFLDCFKVKLLEGQKYKKNTAFNKNAILINQTLVKKAGWKKPIGKEISRNGTLKVMGVVEDFNFSSLEVTVQPMLIMSNLDEDSWGYSVVNIRFQTKDVQNLLLQINNLWKTRFPEIPLEISFLDEVLAMNYKSFLVQQKMISFFSIIGILIAASGLFGLTVFSARTRIKEIGIRKVNGASINEIMILLNLDFIKWIIIAFLIAVPIAYYTLEKWLENFAYKTAISWWIFVLSGLIALTIAVITVSWQSWKAATENPIEALRTE